VLFLVIKTTYENYKRRSNLMILKDNNIIVFIVGIIFALAGFVVIFKSDFFTNQPPMWSGFVVFVAKITTISLDKISNKLLFLRKGLTSKNIKEYNLDQIKEVELSVAYSSSSKSDGYSAIQSAAEKEIEKQKKV